MIQKNVYVAFVAFLFLFPVISAGAQTATDPDTDGSAGGTAERQTSFADSGATAADRALAEEEFRRGVQTYDRGAFNDAILMFEKALSHVPGEPLILEWLGRAYFRSGVESSATEQWQFAADAGRSRTRLLQLMETVRERRSFRPEFTEDSRFVEAGAIESVNGESVLFRQPVSVVALGDGSFWASAYGSNELLHFDANGRITGKTRGPLEGFDRPFDLYRLRDGRLLVSEVGADRVSVLSADGVWLSSFGKKGRGNGELIGPQFIAESDSGNIFVTDYGNARVVVYDSDGASLFTFGEKGGGFPGFKAPAGIAFLDGLVYVCDSVTGALHRFDESGNYVDAFLPPGTLELAESIRPWNGFLLASRENSVLAIDPQTGAIHDVAKLGNAPTRITGAVPDANGNLVLADYRGDSIQIVTRIRELVGGMFVRVQRVFADRFPEVQLEVSVEDRNGDPVVGLGLGNFSITEEGRAVSELGLTGSAYLEDSCDLTVLIDRSSASDSLLPDIRNALSALAASMQGKGTLRVVSAGRIPVQEGFGPPDTGFWNGFRPKAAAGDSWTFDLALRLAANDLINAAHKRSIVFLTTGATPSRGFAKYGLSDLASYLDNNGIAFYVVSLTRNSVPQEFAYLADATGGRQYYLYRPEGIGELARDAVERPNGTYIFKYTSVLPTNFGKAYLPVEVEAWLMNRSGRDERGYFAPLD